MIIRPPVTPSLVRTPFRLRNGHLRPRSSRHTTAPTVHRVQLTGRAQSRFQQLPSDLVTIVPQSGVHARPGRPMATRLKLGLLIPLVILIFSLVQNLDQVQVSPFHRDESRWIGRAFFIQEIFHPFSNTWNDYYITNNQAPFANYIMGIGQFVFGQDISIGRIWDFNYTQAWNELVGAMPTPSEMDAGRRTNALIGAIVAMLVYMVGVRIGNRFGAFIGAAFLACHPLHILMSSQALSDEILALWIVSIFLAAMRFARRPSWQNTTVMAVLLGIGGSTKLTPLLLSFALAGLGVALLVRWRFFPGFSPNPKHERDLGIKLVVQPFIAYFTFVAVFPWLWVDPIGRTYRMFTARAQEMESQGNIWGNLHVATPIDALDRIGVRLSHDYSTTARLGRILADILSFNYQPPSIDLVLGFAGAILFAVLVFRKGIASQYGLLGYLMLCELGIIVVGLKADFNRYHLPIAMIMAICIGYLGSRVWNVLGSMQAWRVLDLIPGIDFVLTGSKAKATRDRSFPRGLRRPQVRPQTPSSAPGNVHELPASSD